ncbi:MAG TPA: MFS transporter [Candidatus Limnocylindria bacterium]|nr:MFS transporter [Candidatus Limnocylindria bacterium]
MAQTTSAPGVTGEETRHLGLALLVIACAQLMLVLDATIVNVALPTIRQALHFSTTNLEWLVTGYALTYGGLLLFGGRTGDLYGKRRMFMVGIAAFALASLLGGFATDQTWLIITRGLQGIGAAIASPTALSLIATNFPEGQTRDRALGIYAAMSGAGGAVGLLLGGVLTTYASWRWVFFVNVFIAAAVLLLTPRVLNESPTAGGKLDARGAITVTAGMISLVYGLTNASNHGWSDSVTILTLLLAAVLLVIFLAFEARHSQPLMPLSIFANRNRWGAYAIMLFIGTSIFSVFFFLTLYLQVIHGYSAIRTGLAFLPMAGAIMVSAVAVSRVVTKLGVRIPLLAGPALACIGMIWMSRITATSGYLSLLGPLLILAVGAGFCFVPLTTTAVAGVPPNETGLASALLNTSQQIGGAVGLSLLGTIAATATNNRLTEAHGQVNQAVIAAATTHGYTQAFTLAAGLLLVALILSALVIRVQRRGDEAEGEGQPDTSTP